jgi:hypothetical protein
MSGNNQSWIGLARSRPADERAEPNKRAEKSSFIAFGETWNRTHEGQVLIERDIKKR